MINYELMFKALADKTRLRIVGMLSSEELCGCKILESLNITQPTLSHHMKILCESGLVVARKDGEWLYYSLSEDMLVEFGKYVQNLLRSDNQ